MSYRTNRRTRKVFRVSEKIPTGTPLILKLKEFVSGQDVLDIILVRDGLKPASFVYLPEPKAKGLQNLLVQLGLVWSTGEHKNSTKGKIVQIYIAKNTRNLQRLR